MNEERPNSLGTSPSPWLRDVRWGEWLFFIAGTGVVTFAVAVLQPGATWQSALASGATAAGAAAFAFIRNPKSLPWMEKERKEEG